MTALQVVRRRAAIRLANWSVEGAVVALALLILAVAGMSSVSPSFAAEEATAEPTLAIVPAKAVALIDATAGAQAGEVRAIGLEAQQINAALPFSAAPVRAAKPFEAPTGGTAYERALTCLTQAVYYEAGFEPAAGRRAVAQVVLNRTRHPAFPKSVCGVVYQRNSTPVCQFSFVCDGSLNRAAAAGAWAESRRIAAAALAGYVEPTVGSATHYHANYVAPRWAPMLAKITQIGAHIFYRWPGAWGQVAAFNGRYIGEPSDPAALRLAARPAVLAQRNADGEIVGVNPPPPGPPVARAANDVGGLLDTSKGWTLSIPLPSDVGSRSQAVAERQESNPVAPVQAIAATAAAGVGPVLAAN